MRFVLEGLRFPLYDNREEAPQTGSLCLLSFSLSLLLFAKTKVTAHELAAGLVARGNCPVDAGRDAIRASIQGEGGGNVRETTGKRWIKRGKGERNPGYTANFAICINRGWEGGISILLRTLSVRRSRRLILRSPRPSPDFKFPTPGSGIWTSQMSTPNIQLITALRKMKRASKGTRDVLMRFTGGEI